MRLAANSGRSKALREYADSAARLADVMSINLENPDTVLGMVDAAANYVAQIRLAMMFGDNTRAMHAVEQAERLLFNATCKIEETESANARTHGQNPAQPRSLHE